MVKKIGEVYKCSVCGNIVEVNHVGGGELVCCGKPMNQLTENTEDAAQEKHLPVITKTDEGIKVEVGSVEHPMEESHHIEWIELIVGKVHYVRYLSPGDKPEAVFNVNATGLVIAREYCNLHGLWKTEIQF